MQARIELVVLPVADVDAALAFYRDRMGFTLEVDHRAGEFRFVQLTPPGSACSVGLGTGITDAAPGSVRALHLVVADVEATRAELVGREVPVSPVRHVGPQGWAPGADPAHADFATYADLADPDGNTWVLQERGHPDRPV